MRKVAFCVILGLISSLPAYPATIFYDDFKNGTKRWEVVSGEWTTVERNGNGFMQLISPGVTSRVINIKDLLFDDFTVEVRINQVTGDAGAHIFFRNDGQHGYWFGFVTSGWKGGHDLKDTVHFWKMLPNISVISTIPLVLPGDQWMLLKVETKGKHARMWYQREGIDESYILAYEGDTLVELDRGKIGFWAGGGKVLVDYILVYDEEGPSQLSVHQADKTPLIWGEIKRRLRCER